MRDIIRAAIDGSGLSNRQIAHRAGVDEIKVRRLRGDEHDLSALTALAIARAVGLELVDSLGHYPRGPLPEVLARIVSRQELRQSAIAAAVGCHKSQISRYLAGQDAPPSELAGKIFELLGLRLVPLGELRAEA